MSYNKIYEDNIIAGASIRDGLGKRIDTNYAYLDSDKKVPVALLPKVAVTVPSVVTGLYITKVSDTTFRVGGGYCIDSKSTTVLSLDSGITKTISVFAEGDGKGSLSAVSGDLIPKMSSATDTGLITSDTTKEPHEAFDKSTATGTKDYSNNGYVGYEFPYTVPSGTYQIYCRQLSSTGTSNKTIKVNIICVDGSEETILSSSYGEKTAHTVFNNVEVAINKPFTAIKFVVASGSLKIQEATIKAPVSSEHTVNLIAKEDGTTDVCIGNRIPEGFVYSRNIGKIILNDTVTAIENYFPKVDLATLYSNNEIALKSDLPTIPTNVSEFNNDAGYQTASDVAGMIASIPQFEIKIVEELPTTGQKMVLYLLPKTSKSGDNIYDEYIWIEKTSSFELVGSTTVNLSDYYTKTDTDSLLELKQDILVNQENIKSVNNQSLLGSGNLDIDNVENITYSELVDLKTNGQLKKGLFYRITDYVTTTNGNSADSAEPSRSAGHQFDVIIQALGPSDLAEIGTCALHEGDTYFANQNLGAWQVWYDINNDTSKYAWAVTDGTGKGVIYRMIDEYNNDFPYDFKNIQFYRDKTLEKYSSLSSGMKAEDGYYYTVTDLTGSNNSDLSLLYGYVYNNKMDAYSPNAYVLNNIISLQYSTRAFVCNNFATGCYNFTFASHVRDNHIGTESHDNILGFNFTLNDIDGYFNNNIVGTFFYGNHIAGYFQNNIVKGTYFEGNNVGEFCSNNNFSGEKYAPYECNIGANFRYNTIGDDIADVTFENNIWYVSIPSGLYQATIKSKLRGSSATNLLDLTGLATHASYNQTIEKDINGRVLATYSDNGVTKGKYKESVTATDWNDIDTTIQIENWEE